MVEAILMKSRFRAAGGLLLSICLAGASDICFSASALVSLIASPSPASINQPVTITVNGDGDTYCGIHVEYSDGSPKTLIRISHEGSKFPYSFTKTFTAAGPVKIEVKGGRVSSALGCSGSANTALLIQAPPTQAVQLPKQATPAIADVRNKARAGDVEAMYTLANVLANNKEDAEAFRLFLAAARKSHVKAMNSTGFMYEEGRGVLQDHKEAAEWYRKATLRGNADAMVNRGVLLFKGLGLPANKSQAYAYFSLGATYAVDPSLRDEAAKFRDDAAKQLTSQQITAAQVEAKKLASQIRN